jgi:chromosome segregation ATPase
LGLKTQEKVQELKQDLVQIHQDFAHLQKQLHQSEETQIAERSAKEKLEKILHDEQQEHAKLLERYDAIAQRLEDYKAEAAQMGLNLELVHVVLPY